MVLQNTDSHGEEITKWGDRPPPTRMQNTGRLCNPLILASPPGPGGVSPRSPVWILQWGCSDQWHVSHVRHVIQSSMEAEPAAAAERWEQFPAPPVVSEGEGGDTILIVSTSAIPRTLARSHTLLRASHHADWARDSKVQSELCAERKHAEFEIVKMNAIKVPESGLPWWWWSYCLPHHHFLLPLLPLLPVRGPSTIRRFYISQTTLLCTWLEAPGHNAVMTLMWH